MLRSLILALTIGVAAAAAQPAKFELSAEQRTGSIRQIFVLQHSHLDIGFTLPADQVARDYKDNIDRAIWLVDQNPAFRWTIESSWMLQQWLLRTQDENLIEKLGDYLRQGRISLGAAFGNMHSGLLGAEEMNRLVYVGEKFRKRFGISSEVAFQNDVPGFSWAYPQVLAKSGVKYLITGLNLFIGGGNNFGVRRDPFYWVGPDGSRVLTFFTYDSYVEGYRWNLSSGKPFDEMEATFLRRLAWLEQQGYPYDTYLLMDSVGDNADPAKAFVTLDRIHEWNKRHPEVTMRLATAEEFFHYLIDKYGNQFSEARGDAAGHWELVKLGAPEASSRMREASALLPVAEALSSFVSLLYGSVYPHYDFEDAWRELLTYHEHTPGAGTGWPGYYTRWQTDWSNTQHYAMAMTGFSNTRQLYDKAVARLARTTGIFDPARKQTSSEVGVFVYNGLSWSRGGPVEVEGLPAAMREGPLEVVDQVTGKVLPAEDVPLTQRRIRFYAPEIPSMGYRLFFLRKAVAAVTNNDPFPVEVTWGQNGYLSSIRDRQTGTEFIAAEKEKPFGALFVASHFEAYEQLPVTTADPIVVENSVTRRIEVSRPESVLRKTAITLYRHAAYVDLAFDVDMDMMLDKPRRYAISMPLTMAEQVWLDGAGFCFRVPQDVLPGGVPPQHAFAQFAHFQGREELGITIGSRDAYLIRPQDKLILLAADARLTQTRDEGAQRLYRTEPRGSNVQSFRFRLALQANQSWLWKRLGNELNLPLQATVLRSMEQLSKEHSFFSVDSPSVAIQAFKPAESREGWYAVRLQELSGSAQQVKISTAFDLSEAVLSNLTENPTAEKADLSRLSLAPWETLTVLVRPQAGAPGSSPSAP